MDGYNIKKNTLHTTTTISPTIIYKTFNLITFNNFFYNNFSYYFKKCNNINYNIYFSKILYCVYYNHFINAIILLSLNLWLIRHKIIYYKEGFSICS